MRSRGCCEACGTSFGVGMPAELDHFWGRVRVAQSDENCWLLCWLCHRQKTNNTPSAAHWLRAFVAHAERYGFIAEAAKARARLESDALVEQAREVGR